MTGMPPRRSSGGNDRVRADVSAAEVAAVAGVPVEVEVEVTNLDAVIRSYRVEVLGLDRTWVSVATVSLDLFPAERRAVTLAITLPDHFPAGRHRVGLEVADATAVPGRVAAAVVGFDLIVAARETLELVVEPSSVTTGATGSFVLTVTNTGNTPFVPVPAAEEPERILSFTFDPPPAELLPGERQLITLVATGKRPWFGNPAVRVVDTSVAAGSARALQPVVLIQRPRISRRLLAFLGLLAVVTLFAFVINAAFNNVAERAEQNEQLLRTGLGEDALTRSRVGSSSMTGSVSSSTGGILDGATVELFDPENPVVPVASTVTTADGTFRFGALAAGEYLLRVEAAGFDPVWWEGADGFDGATRLEIAAGEDLADIDVQLAGRPGSVGGTVLGDEVAGAVVAVQVPVDAVIGGDPDAVPALVASLAVDATGRFVLGELATPATYELVVSQPGFATEVRRVTLGPGEQRDGIDVLLRAGDGLIAGVVFDTAGTPLPNVAIDATDGVTQTATRTLSGDGTAGTFELRDLPTPGTYTLAVTAPGYFPESLTVVLGEVPRVDDLVVVMTADTGSAAGRVVDVNGAPLGGVDVVIDGADVQRSTVTVSDGDVGTWLATGLPAPGAYTATFSRPGFATQAVSFELRTGPEANVTGIDVVLSGGTAGVRGRVVDPTGTPIGGVRIDLEGAAAERSTVSSDDPPGAYGFDGLPPGAYTITYSRAGSRPQTLLVTLRAGETLPLDDIVLERQARLFGTVQRNGIGEAGIGVTVYPLASYPNQPIATTVTLPGGVFELIGLDAPQTYVVEFAVPAGGPVVSSRTVFLQAGEEVELEVDLGGADGATDGPAAEQPVLDDPVDEEPIGEDPTGGAITGQGGTVSGGTG